ncbi:MAG TPA: response regulator [Candidatus Limnocylindrales bacterium]|nr:response regulator [Candidatus Limnocylindrales bacterium]
MDPSGPEGALPLLYIDDSENDRLLFRQAISLTKTPFLLYQADGLEAAMPYFHSRRHESKPRQFPRPALVLLDYDLGNNTGADVLYWLRVKRNITSIPVAMFSGSPGKFHVEECYAMGANHFISKAKNLGRLKAIVRVLYLSLASAGKHPNPITLLNEYQPDGRKGIPVTKV